MHLFAALVPPRAVLDHVSVVAAAVRPERQPVDEPGSAGRHAAGSGRRFGRRRHERPPVEASRSMLDLLPSTRMHVPIARFGNLALTDVHRLTEAMVDQATGWATPRLHLHGGLALEPEGDSSVWARLAGDVDELGAVVRGVSRVAQGLHLFVDRRVFRPEVRIGTITEHTTETYLEQLLSALDALESPSWWQASISLAVPAELGPNQPTYKVHREVPLGPAVPH
jgi:hypothetical protein